MFIFGPDGDVVDKIDQNQEIRDLKGYESDMILMKVGNETIYYKISKKL